MSGLASSSLSTSSLGTRGLSVADLELPSTSLDTTAITIIPLVSIDRVRLLSGLYGPFRPPAPATVPLWVAVYLKRRKKAIVVPPSWMTADSLLETLKQETTNAGFSPLPTYWLGVSSSVLTHASDDVPNSNRVRALLKDIREARQSKILAGVGMINPTHLQMTNISAHEIAELRPFFSTAFSHLKSLRPPSDVEKETKVATEQADRFYAQIQHAVHVAAGSSSSSSAAAAAASRPDPYFDHDLNLQTPSREFESMSSMAHMDVSSSYDAVSSSPADARLTPQAPRKSNVSDSGYHSTHAQHRQSSNDPAPNQHRPPRFSVDDGQDDDDI
ncbi:Psf2-domain-containing protein [Testicularia cyperi]|uniref:DNA replication complex GINS protein PSF2 n=1 Tax=Testicularia cyperi TaxID=1882483 RepID=A0A317XXZ9_9BASI|nr:Psf2-domain-containing protein [Testicularia cyperi]